MLKKIAIVFAVFIGLNVASWLALLGLKQFSKTFALWQNYRAPKIYATMVLMPREYSYHPFLGYSARNPEQPAQNADFKVAVIGGSFADYFAKALIGNQGGVYSYRDKSGNPVSVSFTNLALGGYRQPQQLIASVLNLDDYDLFLSFEGFNELFVGHDTCAPMDWPLMIHAFDPDLHTAYKTMAEAVRGVFRSLYRIRNELPIANLSLYGSGEFLFKLFRVLEERHKASLQTECSQLFSDDSKYTDAMADFWLKNLTKQHRLLRGAGKPLLTFLQPNQYIPGAKTPSAEEKETFAFLPLDRQNFVGESYARAVKKVMTSGNPDIVDLTMIFKNTAETMYIDDCCHVTNEANIFIFNAIQPYLRERLLKN